MKYVIALFLVAMTLQPAAAPACASDGGHDASPHAAMHHGDASPEDKPQCCDPESEDMLPECQANAHCASSAMSIAAIPPAATTPVFTPGRHHRLTQDQRPDALPGPPLLRPPTV